MSLKDHEIPNNSESYTKLKDYPDGEKIIVKGAGIKEGLKYGDLPYFITEDGEELTLPVRYLKYIKGIVEDEDALGELLKGETIVKHSRETQTGGTTPTFEFCD